MGRAEELFERLRKEGIDAIGHFVSDRENENLYLDFKRASTSKSDKSLSGDDRKNLSRAIGGFGNSAGGVIIWGVDCRGLRGSSPDPADVARSIVPIDDTTHFKSLLEGAVSGCTFPPHSGVESIGLTEKGSHKGVVVTLIPQWEGSPLMSIWSGKKEFLIRAGSFFGPTPYEVLSSMFGRRPQARIIPEFTLQTGNSIVEVSSFVNFDLKCRLKNIGRGIAERVFANGIVIDNPGSESILSFGRCGSHWENIDTGQRDANICVVGSEKLLIPPGSSAEAFFLTIRLKPPFSECRVEIQVGSENSPPCSVDLHFTDDQLFLIHTKVTQATKLKNMRAELRRVLGEFMHLH